MADQILHYSDQVSNARACVEYLNHLSDYGLLTEPDMLGLTTYAGLRVVIAVHAVPAINFEAESIQRIAIGDGAGRPGVLGRANLDGSLTDAMVADAAGQSSGSRIPRLCTLVAANVTPDTIESTSRATFAYQV